ncbi:MAG: endonuclease III [Oscillospiraceae bacterium]|jgi:endonuclease-3|nr:endonuclease III [Oscillospiraceae bacterium]
MLSKKHIESILLVLDKNYPNSYCTLNFKNNFELIVAARLSAQCTDKLVNKITPKLFKNLPDARSMALAKIEEIEDLIHMCGIYKNKSKHLKAMSEMIIKDYDGKIPNEIEDLIKLPGIGRKTANLVMAEVFKIPSIIVDTHVSRVTKRIGFHNLNNTYKIEVILRDSLPCDIWTNFCHRIVEHGRKICKARNFKCENCCLEKCCNKNIY